jgi:hypothetical protein
MRMNQPTDRDADPLETRDKALNLRESVNSAKARMFSHREQMNRLRAEIAALRAMAALKAPSAAPAVHVPVPARAFAALPPRADAPAVKNAVAVSASTTPPFRTDDEDGFWKGLPYAAILLAAMVVQRMPSGSAAPRAALVPTRSEAASVAAPAPAPLAATEDDRTDEALLLVHEYRLPGDERPLGERLDSGSNPPGSRPAWTAERTGERTYLVRYQASDAAPGYEFEVDLGARRVDPTPATAELIAPRLASNR